MTSDYTPEAPVLEAAAAEFAAATAMPPLLFDLAPAEGCRAVDGALAGTHAAQAAITQAAGFLRDALAAA
jgi:hypothetical protein